MSDQLIQPKSGDVFGFSYSEASWERAKSGLGHGDLNWCFDGQLVYRDGLLCDTYWGLDWLGDTGRRFTVADAQAKGTLVWRCNLNDVEKIREDEYPLYADGDAFNLSHQHGCYRYYVKRRGAMKDPERLREALTARVIDAERDLDRAKWNLDYAIKQRDEALPRIEAGETETVLR